MSMLGEQVKELREAARNIQGKLGRCLYRRKDVDEMQQVSGMLFEAAATIESLRDGLQTSDGQSCHATQANYERCKYGTDRGWRDTSRYSELFGTPERAARTLARMCAMSDGSCAGCPLFKANLEHCKSDYTHLKSIVEWLKQEVDA